MPSPLRCDFLNRRLAFQPDTENVLSSVNIPIVRRSALAAIPASYSQPFLTLRATERAALRTGYGSVSFVGLYKRRPVPAGFIAEHRFEHRPARVIDGLRHPCFRELGSAHIADDDGLVFPRDARGFDMVLMTARVRDLGVYRADALFVPAALRDGERVGVAPIVLQRRNLRSVGARRKVFQAKVNADDAVAGRKRVGDLALKSDVPATPRILHERAGFEHAFNLARLPETVAALEVNECVAVDFQSTRDERHPAEGAFGAEAGPETRASAVLIAGLSETATSPGNGVGMKRQITRHTASERFKINIGRPLALGAALPSALGLTLRGDAEVPNLIDRVRHALKALRAVRVFNPKFVSDKRHAGSALVISGPIKSASLDGRPAARSLFVPRNDMWCKAVAND